MLRTTEQRFITPDEAPSEDLAVIWKEMKMYIPFIMYCVFVVAGSAALISYAMKLRKS